MKFELNRIVNLREDSCDREPLVRPDEQFTVVYNKICQKAVQELLKLPICQQQKNSNKDPETISRLKQQLGQFFLDQSKRDH